MNYCPFAIIHYPKCCGIQPDFAVRILYEQEVFAFTHIDGMLYSHLIFESFTLCL